MKSMLILDDDAGIRAMLSTAFEHEGFKTEQTSRCGEALQLCEENRYDVIILDYNVEDGIGWELADVVRKRPDIYGTPKLVGISGTVDLNSISVTDLDLSLPKPFDIFDLIAKVKDLSEN